MKYPSSEKKEVDNRTDFEKWGRFSGYFRKNLPYQPKNPGRPAQLSGDDEKKMNAKEKYCLNWACGKKFKQMHNHKRACKCHPGKWDFGYSG